MKDVTIKTKSIPAQPRSKNYPTGVSVVRSSGGNTTIIPGGSGESVDIVKEIDIKSLTDKNVLSSLRTLLEIRSRIIATDNTETEFSEENTLSSLRTVSEIDKAIKSVLQTVEKTYLNKTKPDIAQKVITFLEGLTSDGFVEVNSGLIVRSSKKTTSLSNALIEDSNKDSISHDLIEEEENVEKLSTSLLEVDMPSGTIGSLDNVDPQADTALIGSLLTKGSESWVPIAPVQSDLTDYEHMLIPVFHTIRQQWIFIPADRFGEVVPPVSSGFPYVLPLTF
ncbi:hypothetical protein [Bacteroides nordii]|uniref:hypothetical protein n=2 Tax=Bacteroides TaxID=816 RepID=UPI00399B7C0D